MSYENTNCPCGGTKERDTMLCDSCLEYLADRKEMVSFRDVLLPLEYRRNAAIILLSLSRKRRAGK